MKPSQKAVDLIKKFEGFRDKSYFCPANILTIGYGSTMWMNGTRVKLGQTITKEDAEKLILFELSTKEEFIPNNINQNQADALFSFVYNVGGGNFQKSTLRKLILENPDDPKIKDEFNKWVFSKKNNQMVKLAGLIKRRAAEADLYFEK